MYVYAVMLVEAPSSVTLEKILGTEADADRYKAFMRTQDNEHRIILETEVEEFLDAGTYSP